MLIILPANGEELAGIAACGEVIGATVGAVDDRTLEVGETGTKGEETGEEAGVSP